MALVEDKGSVSDTPWQMEAHTKTIDEKVWLALLAHGPMSADDVVRKTGLEKRLVVPVLSRFKSGRAASVVGNKKGDNGYRCSVYAPTGQLRIVP